MPFPIRSFQTALLVVLAALMLLPASLAQTPVPPATPVSTPAYDPSSLHAIKPEHRDEIAATLPAGLAEYEIDVVFPQDPAGRALEGQMTVTYTNTTGETLDAIPFRLYANSASRGDDAIGLDAVTVDSTAVSPVMSEMGSVATITLPTPLADGDVTSIDISFTTTVPDDEPAHYGMLNHATRTGTWSLAHWYPMVAGRDPGYGWMLKPTCVNGDPVFTDTGMYTVTVTAPDGLQLVTSGVEIDRQAAGDGMTTTTWSAAPSRDFVMLADNDMASVQDEVDGTTVTSWYHGGQEAAGEAALLWTAQSLALFNDLLGEYPYTALQVVPAAMFNAAGVEYPQLFTVSESYYDRPVDLDSHGYFEFTVAHEVVHQWFYAIVGNNQYDDAFIDEGLTNYLSSRVYFTALYGEEVGEAVFERNIRVPFRYMIEANRDVIVATETDAFPTANAYVDAVYIKAPMGFHAIHEALGDDAFDEGLQAYVEDFRFRVAKPADLLAAWNATIDTDLTELWTHWFERRDGALDIRD
jgi:hypothetical protein